jgi:hypothetical protein
MTPSLDDCLASIYEPGFIPADSGVPPTVPTFPFGVAGNAFGRGLMAGAGNVVGTPVAVVGTCSGTGAASAISPTLRAGIASGVGAASALSISTIAAVGSAAASGTLAGVAAESPALDGLSGVTGAYSFSRDLLTSFAGGTKYTTSGSNITAWNDQSGNARNLGTPGTDPVLVTAGPNSRSASSHTSSRPFTSVAGDPLSDFITASDAYVIISFIASSLTGVAASVPDNNGLLSDSNSRFGIYGKSAGTLHCWNNDGVGDSNSVAISTATAYVVEIRHQGGTLGIRINGGSEATVASGNTNALTGTISLANAAGVGLNWFGNIFEAAFFNTVPSLGQRDALAANFKTWIGA